MKLCWDNLEKYDIYLTKNGLFRSRKTGSKFEYREKCKNCGESYLADRYQLKKGLGEFCDKTCSQSGEFSYWYGKKFTEDHKRKIARKGKDNGMYGKIPSDEHKRKIGDANRGEKSALWKGGVSKKNIPLYDTYAHRIECAEEVRRNSEDSNVLEVKCTYCGKWYIPRTSDVHNRVNALNGIINGELRLYCSTGCKRSCPIYRKHKHPQRRVQGTSREVSSELRKIVLERDNWICTKCENTKELHCHHIYPISQNPIESADIDNCIALCIECHKEVHKLPGCKYNELRKKC